MRALEFMAAVLIVASPLVAQNGACCRPSGVCAVTAADECPPDSLFLSQGLCSPSPCPPEPVACCLPDGSCELEAPGRCIARGGARDPAGSCACGGPPYFGACCAVGLEPSCVVCADTTCGLAGGEFRARQACLPGWCDGLDAQPCCLVNEECIVTALWLCSAAGGRPLAGGACDFAVCTELGARACCLPERSQCELHGRYVCASLGGIFHPNATVCESPTGSGNFVVCCEANFNRVGGITVQDVFDFLEAYFRQDSTADIDHSGALGVGDVFAYLRAYFRGCG